MPRPGAVLDHQDEAIDPFARQFNLALVRPVLRRALDIRGDGIQLPALAVVLRPPQIDAADARAAHLVELIIQHDQRMIDIFEGGQWVRALGSWVSGDWHREGREEEWVQPAPATWRPDVLAAQAGEREPVPSCWGAAVVALPRPAARVAARIETQRLKVSAPGGGNAGGKTLMEVGAAGGL